MTESKKKAPATRRRRAPARSRAASKSDSYRNTLVRQLNVRVAHIESLLGFSVAGKTEHDLVVVLDEEE